jgi:outer membrane protein
MTKCLSISGARGRFLAFGLFVLLGSPADATNLFEVVQLAREHDPVYDSARFALEEVRERVPQARAGLLPTVNLTGNNGHTTANTDFSTMPPVDRGNRSWAWSLQLTQPLFRAANVYAASLSERLLEQAQAQFEQAEQALYLRCAQAYFGVLLGEDGVTVADAEFQALDEQLKQVQRGIKAGTHSLTDLEETRARLGLAKAHQVEAANALLSARTDLEKITGEPVGPLAQLSSRFTPVPPEPTESRAWADRARFDSPAVRASQAALAAAKDAVSKTKAEQLPTLDLVVSSGHNYSSNSLGTPDDYSTRAASRQWGLQLNVPLVAGGGPSARVREAAAGLGREQANLEGAKRDAAAEAKQAFAGVQNGIAEIDALTGALEAAMSALTGTRIGFRAGLRINLDVLNAQQQVYTTRRDLSRARYQTLLQGFRLKAAVGALGSDDVLAVNSMLQSRAGVMQ